MDPTNQTNKPDGYRDVRITFVATVRWHNDEIERHMNRLAQPDAEPVRPSESWLPLLRMIGIEVVE